MCMTIAVLREVCEVGTVCARVRRRGSGVK